MPAPVPSPCLPTHHQTLAGSVLPRLRPGDRLRVSRIGRSELVMRAIPENVARLVVGIVSHERPTNDLARHCWSGGRVGGDSR